MLMSKYISRAVSGFITCVLGIATLLPVADCAEMELCRTALNGDERILSTADLVPDALGEYRSNQGHGSEPGCLVVDFSGKHHPEIVLIAVNERTGDATLRIASTQSVHKVEMSLDLGTAAQIAFLSRGKRQIIRISDAFNGAESPERANNRSAGEVAYLTFVGKADLVFFRDEGTSLLRSLQTSD